MGNRQNTIATKQQGHSKLKAALWFSVLLIAGLFYVMPAHAAQVVGTVTDVSGPMVARRIDGTIKALSVNSSIEQGDTLVTEKATYARIRFVDNGEITLRPNTQFKIENFSYQVNKPESDSALFSLLKGGLRSITGLLGKRNKEKFGLNTPTATIGIRGTTFIVEYVPPSQAAMAAYQRSLVAGLEPQYGGSRSDAPQTARPVQMAAAGKPNDDGSNGSDDTGNGMNPGLYVQVLDGMINVKNGGGSQNYTAGQFGFTPGFQQPPVILPNDPGLHFNPPPSFDNGGQGSTTITGGRPGEVNCIVR